jgi:hypothetical protein
MISIRMGHEELAIAILCSPRAASASQRTKPPKGDAADPPAGIGQLFIFIFAGTAVNQCRQMQLFA